MKKLLATVLFLSLTACAGGVDHARDPAPLLNAMRHTVGGAWFRDREVLQNAQRVCDNHDDSRSAEELTAYGFTPEQVAVLLKEAPKYCGK